MREIPVFWVSEVVTDGLIEHIALKEVITQHRSRFQEIFIAETVPFSRCLFIDGKIQSSLLDEHIYHEVLVHPASVIHGRPREVLIIGGGEGGVLREVLRWRSVEAATMVEIDADVVDLCKRYMPELNNGAFNDPRSRLSIDDGRKYLEGLPDDSLDLIIVDATDPVEGGPSLRLYSEEFYELASRRLRDGGVLVTQATSVVHNVFVYRSILKTISKVFREVVPLSAFIPSFSSLWGFVIGSLKPIPRLGPDDINKTLIDRGVSGLRFYSGETHQVIVQVAKSYLDAIPSGWRVIRDNEPITIP
ncbi:MAG: fused MFS/spermidine synthase [Aigarchaeota archaeon]|nr:fused MFS/spermidine synthase [Aigarchaeota archaeon]MDW8092848.1 fused MFS/spermidine synthase [Nitrososphaerota archaeon]